MRWLVRFGYDGDGFAGWASQPGFRTVEGELLRGLSRSGIRSKSDRSGLDVASRTDRGVSARANALVLSAELAAPSLLRLMNGISDEIFFVAARAVPHEFRVREAVTRTYRYFEPDPIGGVDRWIRAAEHFVGRIDVRSFGRRVPPQEPSWREVESVRIVAEGDSAVIEIRARSFVWGMVRKIVGALGEYGAGRLTLARLDSAVRGRERLSVPLAAPERLILWEVTYAEPWEFWWTGRNRRQAAWGKTAEDRHWARGRVLDALTEASAPTSA
jgi:tRNA pseudouridine38-40 synthase